MLWQSDLIRQFRIKNAVIVSTAALMMNGLTNDFPNYLQILTSNKEASNIPIGPVEYLYIEDYDTKTDMRELGVSKNVLVPTAERAIVEYYKDENNRNEETMYQALYSYYRQNRGDTSKLEMVATRHGIERGVMTIALNQAVNEITCE